MDCIILAGDKEHYHQVATEENKAFLTIGERTILDIMLAELAQVEAISRFVVVGPYETLARHWPEARRQGFAKPLLFVRQTKDLMSNALAAFAAADSGPGDFALVLPCDIPLITVEETAQFLERTDMTRCDYAAGLTTAEALSRFYPCGGKPGVRLSYFHLRGLSYRVNNMHLVRPQAIQRMEYIRRTYAIRYQKQAGNVLRMAGHLLLAAARAPGALLFYVWGQTARALWRIGLGGLSRRVVEPFLTLATTERHISKILGTRFKLTVTDLGGAAIDVDHEQDYEAILARFEEWMAMQKRLASEASRKTEPAG